MILMRLDMAAAAAGVSPSTLRRWVAEGRLVKHGDRKPWRVNLEEVEELRDMLRHRLPSARS